MGIGEEKKSRSGLVATIVLIAVLVILAALLIWILRDPRGFDRFKKRKETKPSLKPSVMNQQFRDLANQTKLEMVDARLRVVGQLSWQEPASPPWV
jgi:flagellin-like protein